MGRLFLVALIAFAGPGLAYAQRGAGGVAPAASHAAMGAMHAPVASAHPGARYVPGAPVVARSSGFASHSPRTHRIRQTNAQNDVAPLSSFASTDFASTNFEGVPGLGFDFPHLAAISGGHHERRRFGFGASSFGFGGGFLFGAPVIVEELGSGGPQAAPVEEENAAREDSETDYVRRPRSVSPRDYAAQNAGSGASAVQEEPAEYVFVRRDGGLVFAVAYSWENGTLRYVTRDGMRRTMARDAIDLTATQQFNEQRGLNFRSPA